MEDGRALAQLPRRVWGLIPVPPGCVPVSLPQVTVPWQGVGLGDLLPTLLSLHMLWRGRWRGCGAALS